MTTTQATARPVMLGISDEVLTCECCGKSNLKRTIVLSLDGESDAVYFGSTCGARALQGLGYSVKGPALERQAEAVARLTDSVERGAADLARLQGMVSAGMVRYPIGGVEKGAELSYLCASRATELAHLEQKLAEVSKVAA